MLVWGKVRSIVFFFVCYFTVILVLMTTFDMMVYWLGLETCNVGSTSIRFIFI